MTADMKVRPCTEPVGGMSSLCPPSSSPPDFPTIYRQHVRFVWVSLRGLGVRSSDLEDVVHDVFVIVHKRLNDFDQTCRIKPWLFGISIRVASNYRRRQLRKVELLFG